MLGQPNKQIMLCKTNKQTKNTESNAPAPDSSLFGTEWAGSRKVLGASLKHFLPGR